MRVLALDSSGIVASVAIVEDDTLVAEYTVNYKKTHSQTLLPMLDEIVKMTELDLKTIDAIAVAKGPGSFTGLRIGSATAKVTVSRGVLLFYLKDSSDTSDHFLIHFVLSTNRNTASITNRITT